MKKLLSVVIAIAMIASIASIVTSAASPVTVKAQTVDVREGTTEPVEVKISFADLVKKIKCALVKVEVTGGATLATQYVDEEGEPVEEETKYLVPVCNKYLESGILAWSNVNEEKTAAGFVWADPMGSTGDTDVVGIYVNLPADAKAGAEYEVKISLTDEPGTYLDTSEDDMEPTAVDGKITVIESYIPGDVNGDTRVNAKDIIAVMKYMLGNAPEGFIEAAGDLNNDSRINAKDIILIMKIMLGGK